MDFSSKRVLVTAGANGIGLAIATKFQALGAAVFVTDIDPDAVEKARVNGLAAAVSDVSDEDQVRELMALVQAELGGLDVLVNNAGIAGPTGPSNRWTRPRGRPLSMSTSTASSSASSTPCRCCGRAGKPRS
ncbi:SDR family NAD(P)-dependent oxidoreductase [Arthrobacter sp. OVS8]|nr:SDR family NAD(P)-dependent oxidoreductase [Arthrobacter sp. OVS8]